MDNMEKEAMEMSKQAVDPLEDRIIQLEKRVAKLERKLRMNDAEHGRRGSDMHWSIQYKE